MKAVSVNPADGDEVCEHCGHHEAVEIAGKFLCVDCVAVAASACAGSAESDC